jgi:hypothetical protein
MMRDSYSAVQPRIIRIRNAPAYLGMDRNRFNSKVRPYFTEVPIGKQGIGFEWLNSSRSDRSPSVMSGAANDEQAL